MTGAPSGSGRHRGRFAENAKPAAAVLTGGAALLTAIAGMITLLRSDPGGNPSSAVTTTVVAAPGPSDQRGGSAPTSGAADTPSSVEGTDDSGSSTSATSATSASASSAGSPTPSSHPPTTSSPPPRPTTSTTSATVPTAPDPQWQGTIQVDTDGFSLATVPPSHDQSGNPDISADSWSDTFAASWGAAKWTSSAAPTPASCADLILARNSTQVTAADGDSYCVRVAHSPFNPGRQYAVVKVLAQGRDASNFPYVRVQATVWPNGE